MVGKQTSFAVIWLVVFSSQSASADWQRTTQDSSDLAESELVLIGSVVQPGINPKLITFWRDPENVREIGDGLTVRTFRCFDEIGGGIANSYCEIASGHE
ncbi:hypothetical protein C1J02_19620 [Sulfitobacter sp. SK011]|nr:hypothetical protein C1J02_19620 [Sulfitobacter sp. SK011]